ncbi:uncharacterized protein TNCV_3089481 [Trichonephila clavipes]|nr:uncharacterized protein TNCV_3089481 [Trichonephila clavipes]
MRREHNKEDQFDPEEAERNNSTAPTPRSKEGQAENFQWLPKELHQLKYEAISVPQGSVRLVKKTQERKSSTCYLLITKGVTSSSPVPLKTRRERERCTLNLQRAQTSSCWNGVVVKRDQLKYRPRQPWFKITRSVSKSPRVA